MSSELRSQISAPIAITRTRVLVALSLVVTWAVASLLPHYTFGTIKDHVTTRLGEAKQKIPKVRIEWRPLQQDEDPRHQFNTSKVALLIEPRPFTHLVPLILHMISVVPPPDWRFIFVGTNLSVATVGRSYATKHQQAIGKLDLLILPEP